MIQMSLETNEYENNRGTRIHEPTNAGVTLA